MQEQIEELLTYETYEPTDRQYEAHMSPARYKLYGGAMGGGKSVWLCIEAIRLSIMFPGNIGFLARYRYKDLKRTTLPILMELLPQKLVKEYNKTDGLITLANGSQIFAGDLEKPDKHKSLNLGFFALDEATECPYDVFLMLKTRLRRKVPNIQYFGLLATNPEPGWVKDAFITNPQSDEYQYIPALPSDNPHLPTEYIKDMMDLPLVWRSKYLEGSWDVFDAQIFKPEWMVPSEGQVPDSDRLAVKIMAVDSAMTESDIEKGNDPDETAIVTVGVEYDTNLIHEIETVHGCWSTHTVIANIKAAYNRHKPQFLGVEGKYLVDLLNHDGVPAFELKPDKDKIRRALTVQRAFEQGKVRVNNQAVQRQCIEFPKGSHDDLVDALVYAVRMVSEYSQEAFNKPPEKPVLYSMEDRVHIWQEKRRKRLARAKAGGGRDPVLGGNW